MPAGKSKESKQLAWNELTPDTRRDVLSYLEPILRRAEEDAELVCQFFQFRGVKLRPGTAAVADTPDPAAVNALLKIAAFRRLLAWERTPAIANAINNVDLPAAAEVLKDLATRSPKQRIDGKQLAFNTFTTWQNTLSWSPIALGQDVVVKDVTPDDAMGELAKFLWQSRHLAPETNVDRCREVG